MAAVRWFIAREGQKVGPFSPSELRQLAVHGLLQPSEMVWTEGMSKWVEAGSIPALFPRQGQKRYWLSVGGQVRGPYAADQLRAAVTARELSLETQACPETGKDWQPLNRMTEFRDFVAPPVSPSQARLLSGSLDAEEARLHLAGKAGDALARLISTLMDLKKAFPDNPALLQSLDQSIRTLQEKRDEAAKSEQASGGG
jgi:hypothetical protein